MRKSVYFIVGVMFSLLCSAQVIASTASDTYSPHESRIFNDLDASHAIIVKRPKLNVVSDTFVVVQADNLMLNTYARRSSDIKYTTIRLDVFRHVWEVGLPA